MDILDTTFLSPKQWKKTSCVFIVFKEGGGLIDSHPTISTEKVNTTCKTLLFIMFINQFSNGALSGIHS